jgi:Kef-type K+ transport system membrane component KefB
VTPFLQLAFSLALIITAAKAGAYLSIRLGQPAVLGELLVGILLGPSIVDLLHLSIFPDQHLSEVVHELAEIGVLLLMFLAGLDLHLSDLLHSGKVSVLSGTLGVVFPLVLGTAVAMLFGIPLPASIFIGLILSATSVSISAQTLIELKALRSRVGTSLLGAAVFDDILVILGLSIFIAVTNPGSGGGAWQILWVVLQMMLYLAVASLVGWWLLPRLVRRVVNLPVSQGLISFVLVTILIYGWLAEVGGQMAAITGAFLAGLWLSRTSARERIHSGISSIAYGLFVPIFFINIGLSTDLHDLTLSSLYLLLVLLLVAVVGKVFGAGWGASLAGFTRREALQLGVGMMSRGEVGLIVATVGINEGLISVEVFSAVVGIVVATTLLTPLMLRWLFKSGPKQPESAGPLPEGVER